MVEGRSVACQFAVLLVAACSNEVAVPPDAATSTDAPTIDAPMPTADAPVYGDPLAGTGPVSMVQGGFMFTEGPLWIASQSVLLFTDTSASIIYQLTPPSTITPFRMNSNAANGLALDEQGRLIACEGGARRVTRTLAGGTIEVVADHYMGMRFNSPNDVIVRSDGTIYFTDPDYGLGGGTREINFQGVYRVPPGGQPVLVDMTLSEPNGIALSNDEHTLYVDDTVQHIVRSYPVAADGSTGAGTLWVTTAANSDGMAIDDAGNLYVTTMDGIQAFRPDASLIGTITVPQVPANCSFGGPDRRMLYVTARTGLYAIHLNVPGKP